MLRVVTSSLDARRTPPNATHCSDVALAPAPGPRPEYGDDDEINLPLRHASVSYPSVAGNR